MITTRATASGRASTGCVLQIDREHRFLKLSSTNAWIERNAAHCVSSAKVQVEHVTFSAFHVGILVLVARHVRFKVPCRERMLYARPAPSLPVFFARVQNIIVGDF